MGQRLVIKFVHGGYNLGSAYFHWSGFTDSACYTMNKTIRMLGGFRPKTKKELGNFLIDSGMGVSPEEQINVENILMRRVKLGDRNLGLIALSEEGIERHLRWAENLIIVDLRSGEIDCDKLLFVYELKDYIRYKEMREEKPDYLDMSSCSTNPMITSIEYFNIWANWVASVPNRAILWNGTIYQKVEC